MGLGKGGLLVFGLFLVFAILFINVLSANSYLADIYFTIPDSVFITGEQIEIKGYVHQANYSANGSLVSSSAALANATVNFTILNSNHSKYSNYTFTTDANGSFYSRSNFYPTATQVTSPTLAGDYYLRAEYIDNTNTTWFSELGIVVLNKSVDTIKVNSNKAEYNPSETITIEIQAIKQIGDRTLYVSNISVNGTLRNETSKAVLSSFNCTTSTNGKCTTNTTAPSTYGEYIIEANNFTTFSSLSVVPFSITVYMKDELGQSLKNTFAIGEQGKVEVSVLNASSSDSYTFSGYIKDSSENIVKTITSTTLNSNNSFTNTFLFTVDAISFGYGAYSAYVTVSKTGDGSISSSASFEVKDWSFFIGKKSVGSGFEYGWSVFPNKTMNFELYPSYRSNGSIVENISSSSITLNLEDNLGNIISTTDSTWNVSCGTDGCYQSSLTSPSNTGEYSLEASVSYNGVTQTKTQIINVISSVMSTQSTDQDGNLKELFGTNEYSYISITSYNSTVTQINISDAEIFTVEYMNGTEINYTEVSNFSLVDSSNSVYEWAWNSSLQRIKLDVPKIEGLYNVYLFGENRTIGATSKFIVNPYDFCSVPKNTPGTVSSGYYYVWQFKTTDTIYFEIKLAQANNPLGKASALNTSVTNGTGTGSACNVDSTKQSVSNATITISEVKNMESGAVQNLNTTESTCQASDNSGGYTCTVKPLNKWDGGPSLVKFRIIGQDGTTSTAYSRFEARAFYLYGWSQVWQNGPTSNLTLNVQMYEAGNGWWGSSSGLSGTVTLKKVEYQGRAGEWIWPPVDSGYNVSTVNSTSVTGSTGTLSIPVSGMSAGSWKTGSYRAILQGTTSAGDTDYGYAWFGIKQWDVYGQPIECTSSSCQYKDYFNSKNNITLYVKVSTAGDYSYSYQGGQSIGGNVTVSVKKIEDCRTWPCKELNSTNYVSTSINVNSSSQWYWNANLSNAAGYLIQINTTTGSWGTGYYSVTLDVNGTDAGYAWFNTIAFYVATRPTDENGTNYKYSIKPNEKMYFNVTATKDYKGWYATYNSSDYVNVTLDDVVLRSWESGTWRSLEYNYPENITASPLLINGTAVLNISYNHGTWPSGYYYGELTLRNSDNETSRGWLWFDVRPFRVSLSASSYEIDDTQCINTSLYVYEPNWYSNSLIYGNHSVTEVSEDLWSGSGRSSITYTNYTTASFNATTNISICPNNGTWGGGSWGGYHYLNIVVKNNSDNTTEKGWLSFRTVPFRITWGSVFGGSNQMINSNIIMPVTITTYSTGLNTTGNLTRVYQWRYDNYRSTLEEYVFSVGSCFSNVSSQCTVNGTQNITVYAPSGGWKVSYNYLTTEWGKTTGASTPITDWSGIYFDGREAYNGYFQSSDANGYYKYDFVNSENITIKLYVRNSSYHAVNVNVTSVEYSNSGSNCWDEWCRTYTSATWSLIGGGVQINNGSAIITIRPPSSNWSTGQYYIKAGISGSSGTATIKGGNARVKDMTAPNVTMTSPVLNLSITGTIFHFNATTTESANCYVYFMDYGTFYSSNGCGSIANGTNVSTASLVEPCNMTKYSFNNSTSYYWEYISKDYHQASSGPSYIYWGRSGASGLITDGTVHRFVLNTTDKAQGGTLPAQDYGVAVSCYDSDYNYGRAYAAFEVNVSSALNPFVTINTPIHGSNNSNNNITISFILNKLGTCLYSLNNGTTNRTMSTTDNLTFTATNYSMADGNYKVNAYCNDSYGNRNSTVFSNFTVDATYPLIDYGAAVQANNSNLTQNWIYVNVSFTETNFANITFLLRNYTSQVNSSTYAYAVYAINWTGLSYTNYTYNVSIYDFAGNVNSTQTRYVNLSTS